MGKRRNHKVSSEYLTYIRFKQGGDTVQKIHLFSGQWLSSFLQRKEQAMYQEIETIGENELLNGNIDDLINYFVTKYSLQTPVILSDRIEIDKEEAKVDVTHPLYDAPLSKRGFRIKFFVPYEGEKELFYYTPSKYISIYPIAHVNDSELIFSYESINLNNEALKREFERDLELVNTYLRYVEEDVKIFNDSIMNKCKTKLEERKKILIKSNELVTNLGYPLRRRENAPKTYVVPEIRRKINVHRPVSPKTTPPDPTIDMKEYEHILSVITNMVQVMERSPRAFSMMKEEELRMHFLVQLNAQYEGQATGETFNFNGKTDILVRYNGKNLFIAECKFWKGPKKFRETIDQLLSYTTWRDTKTAIIIFNKNKNLTSVLNQIQETLSSHHNFVKKEQYDFETGYRVRLHHPDDKEREIILTVLVFEIPDDKNINTTNAK